MTWSVYVLAPVDFGWDYLKTVAETLADITTNSSWSDDLPVGEIEEFMKSWEDAKNLARVHGWEGDFREDPRVFWLPSEHTFVYGFVFKQDNNGTTFVVSPQPLPSVKALSL